RTDCMTPRHSRAVRIGTFLALAALAVLEGCRSNSNPTNPGTPPIPQTQPRSADAARPQPSRPGANPQGPEASQGTAQALQHKIEADGRTFDALLAKRRAQFQAKDGDAPNSPLARQAAPTPALAR